MDSAGPAPPSTSARPAHSRPDPTEAAADDKNALRGRGGQSGAAAAAQLASLQVRLKAGLRQYPDFPEPGVLFEDIMPIFAQPGLHDDLVTALQLLLAANVDEQHRPDVIVGLDARGFLFGPTLALRLDAGFVPVRKRGKLPGRVETAEYKKEYGADFFQIQSDSIRPGQKVVVVDDIIATGGSAAAAGQLVRAAGGDLVAYVFLMELDFLKGRDKLDAPVFTLLSGQQK